MVKTTPRPFRKPLFLQAEELSWEVPGVSIGGGMSYNKAAKAMKPPNWAEDEDETDTPAGERPLKWATNGKIYWITTETVDRVEPGMYSTGVSDQTGPYLAKMLTTTDELVALPDAKSTEVVEAIKDFWKRKDLFTKFGMLHKRGVMLYGPPGSGKTTTIQQLIEVIVKDYKGVAVFIDHPLIAASVLQSIRKVEPERPVIALLEDIDELIHRHGLSGYLALLDGEAQVDNVVFIATTNHPKSVDERLARRPGRFDRAIHIDMPTAIAREAYIKNRIVTIAKEEMDQDSLDAWVKITEDFSVAQMRELVVSVKCLGHDLHASAEIIREMSVSQDEILESRQPFGFTGEKK